MKVTISDIARKCNVSIGTVSGVLHDKANVKEATKQRVREAMRELNYVPYNNNQLVARQETETIGLVVPEVFYQEHSIITRAILNFKEILDDTDYTCVIYTQKEVEKRVLQTGSAATGYGIIAGALVAFSCFSDTINRALQKLADTGLPVVLVRRHEDLTGVPEVLDNGADGVTQVMEHLYQFGHRRFVYVDYTSNQYLRDREAAFRRFLVDHDLSMDDQQVLPYYPQRRDPTAWLEVVQRTRPTALVCADDAIALDTISVLRDHGIRVPRDMAVTGFNDSPACRVSRPELTSVAIPLEQMLRLAIRQVEDVRQGIRAASAVTTFKDELIIRESSGSYLSE